MKIWGLLCASCCLLHVLKVPEKILLNIFTVLCFGLTLSLVSATGGLNSAFSTLLVTMPFFMVSNFFLFLHLNIRDFLCAFFFPCFHNTKKIEIFAANKKMYAKYIVGGVLAFIVFLCFIHDKLPKWDMATERDMVKNFFPSIFTSPSPLSSPFYFPSPLLLLHLLILVLILYSFPFSPSPTPSLFLSPSPSRSLLFLLLFLLHFPSLFLSPVLLLLPLFLLLSLFLLTFLFL
jgi:hypothetical protein